MYIATEEEDFVKEYLWMRDGHKDALKKIKQQIDARCLRHGHYYGGAKWTAKHVAWLRKLEVLSLLKETLDEYMVSYDERAAKVERFEQRIEEIASQE